MHEVDLLLFTHSPQNSQLFWNDRILGFAPLFFCCDLRLHEYCNSGSAAGAIDRAFRRDLAADLFDEVLHYVESEANAWCVIYERMVIVGIGLVRQTRPMPLFQWLGTKELFENMRHVRRIYAAAIIAD